MYFDDCKNPRELGELIKEILDCCFEDNALSPELLKRLFPASERTWPNSLPMYLSTLYNKARYKALEFRKENPRLPSLPKEQGIGFKGLESILEWCIDSQKPAETKQNATRAKCWRIWTFVKGIPRWIYVLVPFLAALLTCLYYLGWLEAVKAFFKR